MQLTSAINLQEDGSTIQSRAGGVNSRRSIGQLEPVHEYSHDKFQRLN